MIANRGVAAVRIARSLATLGIRSIGLSTLAEESAGYWQVFDEVRSLGDGPPRDTYLNAERIVEIAQQAGAQAIHPGYGFLSENSVFAAAVESVGMRFIGPAAATIEVFGLKHRARELAQAAGVDLLPGSGVLAGVDDAVAQAVGIGYPVMLKSSAGGGGIGMQRCADEFELRRAYDGVATLAQQNFATAEMFVEKCLDTPRHVEVQIFGDGHGNVAVFGDRDCSLQRRNQKVVEEAPAPGIPDEVRRRLHSQARQLAESVNYASAGTVEFLYDAKTQASYFLEVNTRIQVEHGVTEAIFDVDLVAWMIRLAAGELPTATILEARAPRGHAIQTRVYAEDPWCDFQPAPGDLYAEFAKEFPATPAHYSARRIDTWLGRGETHKIPHRFDALLANVICWGESREHARQALVQTLETSRLVGSATNLIYLQRILNHEAFVDGQMHTRLLAEFSYSAAQLRVVEAGMQTSLQSWPGRQGYWEVGVPPSGPMDDRSFRVGNELLGNPSDAAGLECALRGPTLEFRAATTVLLAGAVAQAKLDGEPVSMWQAIAVARGQTLSIGDIRHGMRCYLLVAGGLKGQSTLGSDATFSLGGLGGQLGRNLITGDVLSWRSSERQKTTARNLAVPDIAERHHIRVLIGPHGAPDFMTPDGHEQLFKAQWRVHHNSSRTGVRLIGPTPDWARTDGGEAGLHPSNVHDNAYAFGSIDFTGDMPVVLGPDGPSLGGFVCPAVVITADRWKLGQLVPAETVHLVPVDEAEAQHALMDADRALGIPPADVFSTPAHRHSGVHDAVLWAEDGIESDASDRVVVRRAGQEWLLVEFGPPILELGSRLAAQQLYESLRNSGLPGLIEFTPGIRSLQIRYDCRRWRSSALIRALEPYLQDCVSSKPDRLPSRVVRLPLSWDDPACRLAIERYVSNVRPDAPWCPDNIEFIRRINGLDSVAAVRKIVFDASYLVYGLGDVYLGAPVATPIDPQHRLVTTKYNPARTWTAENSVGIGGAYLCVYGMEGPGGYQFVGRTVPVWSRLIQDLDNPWLLRHFDQLQFFDVDHATLIEMREATRRGSYRVEVAECEFNLTAHRQQLLDNEAAIQTFKKRQQSAFESELAHWQDIGALHFEVADTAEPVVASFDDLEPGERVISPVAASIWRIENARSVQEGDTLVVLEAMKSELEINAPASGRVEMLVAEGDSVQPGQVIALIQNS